MRTWLLLSCIGFPRLCLVLLWLIVTMLMLLFLCHQRYGITHPIATRTTILVPAAVCIKIRIILKVLYCALKEKCCSVCVIAV